MTCFLFRLLEFLLAPRIFDTATVQDARVQPPACEPQPPVADRATLTRLYVRCKWPPAADRVSAALWVDLVCGDACMADYRSGARVLVTDPVAQWSNVYYRTPLECLN